MLLVSTALVSAEPAQHGILLYEEHDNHVVIVGSDPEATGKVAIPETINGKPVTAIGQAAFQSRHEITDVSIPESVTSIGTNAFQYCSNLENVNIPSGVTVIAAETFYNCYRLVAPELPSGLTAIGPGAFYRSGITSLSIPEGVTEIGTYAFGFSQLRKLRIPDSVGVIAPHTFGGTQNLATVVVGRGVTAIGYQAFLRASGLSRVIFLGDAPTVGEQVFVTNAADFATYHFDGAAGFTTPTWEGQPSVNIGSYSALKVWLLENGLPHDTDPAADANGDGVGLLLAYALNLDPNESLAGALPQAIVEEESLRMSFFGAAEGVVYIPEASVDLAVWTTAGVDLSEPDDQRMRTASVAADSPALFLRLRVELE